MTTPPITALDREAAATVFDARAKRASHPAMIALEWHHAKVIRAGEGDAYDAVQAAAVARTAAERATSPAGDAGEVERLRSAVHPLMMALNRFHHFDDPERSGRGARFKLYALPDGGALRELLDGDEPLTIATLEAIDDALALLPQAGDADVVGEVSIEAALGVERCKLCMTYAPRSFCHECDRPECPYRGTAHPHASASDVVGEPGA